ncbi:unnamed protein product [Urochloa decumbens]|uniref:Uncharacterized protein n=1 Tax=Urochloa decumbens TaxID=240449 RepID=A0ABC8ZKT1_9POAL
MADLPVVEVRVLADALNLEHTDAPHRVIVRGVETVRDALPMLAALTKKALDFKGVVALLMEAEEGGHVSGGDDDSDSDYDTGDEGELCDTSDDDDDCDAEDEVEEEGWVLVNMKPLRPVAVLAVLLDELIYDIVPQLIQMPGDRDLLLRLLVNGKEIHRVGPAVPGQPGELSVRLGNKVQKLVSHAFQDRHGVPRTEAQRAAWVTRRRNKLRDEAQKLYLNYAVELD